MYRMEAVVMHGRVSGTLACTSFQIQSGISWRGISSPEISSATLNTIAWRLNGTLVFEEEIGVSWLEGTFCVAAAAASAALLREKLITFRKSALDSF